MINLIKFKFGLATDQPTLELEPTAITVFVGPNNSGKSKAITEIAEKCRNPTTGSNFVIIDDIKFNGLNKTKSEEFINDIEIKNNQIPLFNNLITVKAGKNNNIQRPKASILDALENPNSSHKELFGQIYLGPKTMILNGSNRIKLVDEQNGGDMQKPPETSFQKLFRDDLLRKNFSNLVFKGLGNHAVIDPTHLGKLRLRLSAVAPPSPEVERGLGETSIAFHAAAQSISNASDGAKAFTGILAEILAGDPKILLMDEPEAFLHPALAFKLGYEIAQSMAGTDKHMFVSTHSSQFLMGCIQSGIPINVVRLTYRHGIATARLLPNDKIVQIMRNPLLRSTGVISALFYESVVVTEADPDRAFYQEINERLLQKQRGIPNCIFLNAQNKQTIPTIVTPLRDLGIPVAGIYDIDFIKCQRVEATRLMDAAGIPPIVQRGLTTTRSELDKALPKANSS
ncbi:ATP-dependent nuclease [Acetobacter persici]|uniref:ATPase AAA-type core domain-containing protein n=1 Tax=Acetobacter persici TaxID=1076596 RepID=A0A6V8I4F0_9PROT|nr:AAA family ATPase [Acetobacter persici]GFE91942.1 hypothetical protein DmAi_00010 [Acetobacter persici]